MKSLAKQRGVSFLGWLIIIAIGGFLLMVGFKVAPLYLDNKFVNAALGDMAATSDKAIAIQDARNKLAKSFQLNNVRDLDLKSLAKERRGKEVLLTFNYEKRINFAGNLDIVVSFTNEFPLK